MTDGQSRVKSFIRAYADRLKRNPKTTITVMVVGIGFFAVLTAAIAQRFADVAVSQEIEQAEEALHATDEEVLGEIRAIRTRPLERSMLRRRSA